MNFTNSTLTNNNYSYLYIHLYLLIFFTLFMLGLIIITNIKNNRRNNHQIQELREGIDNSFVHITNLKFSNIKENFKLFQEDKECVICLDNLKNNFEKNIIITKCNHVYHKKC